MKPEKKVEKVDKPDEEAMPEMSMEQAMQFKQDLAKMRDKYEPKWVESHWYQQWLDKKYFSPDAKRAAETNDKKFIMLVPPPSIYS